MITNNNFRGQLCFKCEQPIHGIGVFDDHPEGGITSFHTNCHYEYKKELAYQNYEHLWNSLKEYVRLWIEAIDKMEYWKFTLDTWEIERRKVLKEVLMWMNNPDYICITLEPVKKDV